MYKIENLIWICFLLQLFNMESQIEEEAQMNAFEDIVRRAIIKPEI
jgi:hypothetical protein